MDRLKSLILALGIVAAILFAFMLGRRCPKGMPKEPIKVKMDTLVIRDTLVSYEPVFVERHRVDSVLVPVLDSVMIHDTLFVFLEREQVVWQDSLSCVYASGILPQVDSVKHFVCDKIVTIEKTIPVKIRSHWGLGVNAGYGVGKGGLTPYVGVGISYNFISW